MDNELRDKKINEIHDTMTRLDERVSGPNGTLSQLKSVKTDMTAIRDDVNKLKSFRVQLVAWASGIATGVSYVAHKLLGLIVK